MDDRFRARHAADGAIGMATMRDSDGVDASLRFAMNGIVSCAGAYRVHVLNASV